MLHPSCIPSSLCSTPNLPDINRPLTNKFNCTGWPEPRIYVEGQVWVTEEGGDPSVDAAHLHVGACMPWNQTLSGLVGGIDGT